MKRTIAALLCLMLLVSVLAGIPAYASAPSASSIGKNMGKRHEVCTGLSDAAKAYYPDGSTYSELIALPGTATDSSVEAIGSPLFNKLKSMMQPVDTISYSSLTSYWKYTDATEGSSDACLFYSDVVSSSYNREHVWPKSRGNFYQSGAGSDIQHLRPTDSTINSTRGNMTMGNVKAKSGYTVKTKDYNGKTVLWYISNYTDNDCQGLVEVADNVKGDVARIYLYVYVTYGAENANKNLFTKCGSYGASDNDGNKVIESLDTLLEWCAIDPVDEWEMQRNDLCQKVQGNRNVFIDYPELGWYLFDRQSEMPGDMPTPSGMASGTTPTSYTITAVSNNEAWGSVTLNGRVIDAEPAEGFFAAGYTVLEGEATVTQVGNRFSVSPKSDCTVQINFAAKESAEITCFLPDGSQIDLLGYTGEEISLPATASTIEGWRFIGWTETQLSGSVLERPVYYEPGGAFIPAGDTTFYALYTMIDDAAAGEPDSYQLLTELPAQLEGTYVLTSEDADYVLLCDGSAEPGTFNAAKSLGSTGITKSGDKLTGVSDSYVLLCEHVSGSNYSFRLKGCETPAYLMTNDSNGGFKTADSSESLEAQWTVSVNGGGAVISNAQHSARSIRFNSGSCMFRTYNSGQSPVYLWKSLTSGKVYYATSPVVEAHEHECALAEAKAATCTENGWIEHLYCGICGKCFSMEKWNELHELIELPLSELVIPALGHSWGAWAESKAATCTEAGEESRGCTRCDAAETRDTEALGHDWGEVSYVWAEDLSEVTASRVCKRDESHVEEETAETTSAVTLAPTAEAEGETTYTAHFENEAFETQTETEVIPKLEPTDPCAEGHSWNEGVTVRAASCLEDGEILYTCTVCEATQAAFLPALGHDWGEPTYVWAEDCSSCTATRVCKRDEGHAEDETVEAAAEVTTPATVEAEGEITYTATFENEAFATQTKTEAIPKLDPPDEPQPDNPFDDVEEGKFFYDAVLWAVNHEPQITNGTDATHFAPGAECTRGQVVTFLWRAYGQPEPTSTENPFEDVAEGKFYYKAVLWAVEMEITNGVDATHFGPDATCTRGQVVTFLWRAAGKPSATVSVEPGENETPIVPFNPDGGDVECPFEDVVEGAFYYDAMLWAVANEVTNGTSATTFSPGATCTRGQVVTFLYRAVGK